MAVVGKAWQEREAAGHICVSNQKAEKDRKWEASFVTPRLFAVTYLLQRELTKQDLSWGANIEPVGDISILTVTDGTK